ncbi:MAG: 3-hydroxyacyl-ACP dehydratase FabZ family protein [Phycisphaerae bacterium]
MRWIWIDAFVGFVSGKRASAVKNITLAEEYLHDHLPGYPVYPPCLMIEGMAQTGGILAGEARAFEDNVILAKIRQAKFWEYAYPGDQLRYDVSLDSIDERAAVTSGKVYKNGAQIGVVDLLFSHIRADDESHGAPGHNFVFTDQFMSLLATFRGAQGGGSAEANAS